MKDRLNLDELIQPKDKDHVLYKLLDQYLIYGDQKQIATKLKVKEQTVSDVKGARTRSRKVWSELVSIMLKRKSELDKVLQHMNQIPV